MASETNYILNAIISFLFSSIFSMDMGNIFPRILFNPVRNHRGLKILTSSTLKVNCSEYKDSHVICPIPLNP